MMWNRKKWLLWMAIAAISIKATTSSIDILMSVNSTNPNWKLVQPNSKWIDGIRTKTVNNAFDNYQIFDFRSPNPLQFIAAEIHGSRGALTYSRIYRGNWATNFPNASSQHMVQSLVTIKLPDMETQDDTGLAVFAYDKGRLQRIVNCTLCDYRNGSCRPEKQIQNAEGQWNCSLISEEGLEAWRNSFGTNNSPELSALVQQNQPTMLSVQKWNEERFGYLPHCIVHYDHDIYNLYIWAHCNISHIEVETDSPLNAYNLLSHFPVIPDRNIRRFEKSLMDENSDGYKTIPHIWSDGDGFMVLFHGALETWVLPVASNHSNNPMEPIIKPTWKQSQDYFAVQTMEWSPENKTELHAIICNDNVPVSNNPKYYMRCFNKNVTIVQEKWTLPNFATCTKITAEMKGVIRRLPSPEFPCSLKTRYFDGSYAVAEIVVAHNNAAKTASIPWILIGVIVGALFCVAALVVYALWPISQNTNPNRDLEHHNEHVPNSRTSSSTHQAVQGHVHVSISMGEQTQGGLKNQVQRNIID